MRAFTTVRAADFVAMERVAADLRQSNAPDDFARAGALLASVVLREEPSESADRLAAAMLGSLMLVEARDWKCGPDERVACSAAAFALAVYRPHAARACEVAVGRWMGMGIGSPQRLSTEHALSMRILLALFRDDPQDAAETLEQVAVRKGALLGVLCDWLVARIQQHGVDRELQCFEHLCLELVPGPGSASLALVALSVVGRRAGVSQEWMVLWWEGVLAERAEKVRPKRQEVARAGRVH